MRALCSRSPGRGQGVGLVFVLFLFQSAARVSSEFLDTPEVLWTLDLPAASNTTATSDATSGGGGGGGGNAVIPDRVAQGNAVTVSADGAWVYVTEADGRVHVVSASSQSRRTYVPSLVSGATATFCASGVVLHSDFAVYAVLDTTSDGGDGQGNSGGSSNNAVVVGSRLVAVDSRAREVWSVSLGGMAVGTPYLSGNRIYVTRNTDADNGYVSVVEFDSDQGTAEVVATLPDPAGSDRIGRLGPPAGHRVELDSVSRDVVVVALSPAVEANNANTGGADGNGNANNDANGGLYALVPSSQYDDLDGRGADAYELRLISTYPLQTSLRPAFDGTNCYLAHQSRLSGWDGEQSLLAGLNGTATSDLVPNWESRRSNGNTDDQSLAYPAAPILSSDSTFLIVSTSSPGINCFDIQAGQTIWSTDTDGVNLAEPIVANITGSNDVVVYAIQESGGVVRQFDASDGALKWEFPCSMVTGDDNCDLSVQADFSMARSGNRLYYSFTNGTVVALSVGDFPTEAPTTAPSAAPNPKPVSQRQPSAAHRPTSAPSLRGSALNDTTGTTGESSQNANGVNGTATSQQQPSSNAAGGLSLPIILGAAAGGLVLLILAMFCCTFCKRKRLSKDERERAKQELEAVRKWNQEKEAYEKECKEQEQQTLKEIVGPPKSLPSTPLTGSTSGTKPRSNSANLQKSTPLTLDSITEDADFDDGSEAGVEISLSDKSEVLTISNVEGGIQPATLEPSCQPDPDGLLGPLDPHIDSDHVAREPFSHKSAIEPLVRNLSESFTAQVDPAIAPEVRSSAQLDPPIRETPRDPEPTGMFSVGENGSTAHSELAQAVREVRKAKLMDSSVVSASSTDAGLPIVYRVEDDIVPAQNTSKTTSEETIDYRGRPTSPAFSDIWSVDESLYIDEESKTGRDKFVHQVEPFVKKAATAEIEEGPDDEPGKISKGVRPKSPPAIPPTSPLLRPKSPPLPSKTPSIQSKSPQLQSPPPALPPSAPTLRSKSPNLRSKSPILRSTSPVLRLDSNPKPDSAERSRSLSSLPPIPVLSKHESNAVPVKPLERKTNETRMGGTPTQLHDRDMPQARGGSARPKAGLFTRLENSIVSSDESDSTGAVAPVIPATGYMEEREARAAYIPSKATVPSALESGNQSTGSSLASSRQTTRASNQTSLPSRAQDVASSVRPSSRRVRKLPDGPSRPSQSAAKTVSKMSSSVSKMSSAKGTKAYSAWDSFLTELAKVEDTFFNPKLGNPQSQPGAKRSKRRAQPPPRKRSQSKDEGYSEQSDSDSDSSDSAGLNPVDRFT